jgi:hypothetical protein
MSPSKSAQVPRSAPVGSSGPPTDEDLPRTALRRGAIVGSALIVAAAAGFGIDQLVSGGATTKPRSGISSGSPGSSSRTTVEGAATTPPTLPGGLYAIYLASAPQDVVGLTFSGSPSSITGTGSALQQIGQGPSTAFVTSTVKGYLNGSTLHISFNGGPEEKAQVSGGTFTVSYPLPDGDTANLTFRPSTAKAIAGAQNAMRLRLEPGLGTTTVPSRRGRTTTSVP